MVNVFWFDSKQVSDNMAHFYETPNLVEGGYVFGLQTVYAIVERVCTAKQIPSSVHLTVTAGFLQNEAFLIHALETSDGSEEWIPL